MIARVGQDGQVDWEYTSKEPTVATEPKSSDDWGEPYVDPRKNWEKASDEDFFNVANLPAGFYGRLRDPEFRADVEKYEKAVRDGDLSPTGERARLMKKHPVLKMMTQKDTSITGNEIDTYIDPKFLKAVQVANRNEKLIPTGKTTTPSQGVVATPDAVDNIAPKADERRDEIIPDNRIASDALQRPGTPSASPDVSNYEVDDQALLTQRFGRNASPGNTEINRNWEGPIDGPRDEPKINQVDTLGNFDYEDGVQSTAGMDGPDDVDYTNKSQFSPNKSTYSALMKPKFNSQSPLYSDPLTVQNLKKPKKKDIKQQTISAEPKKNASVASKGVNSRGLDLDGITSKKNNIVQQRSDVPDKKSLTKLNDPIEIK